ADDGDGVLAEGTVDGAVALLVARDEIGPAAMHNLPERRGAGTAGAVDGGYENCLYEQFSCLTTRKFLDAASKWIASQAGCLLDSTGWKPVLRRRMLPSLPCGSLLKIGRKPFLGHFHAHALPRRIRLQLIPPRRFAQLF